MLPRRGTSAALAASTSAAAMSWGVRSYLLRATAGQAPGHRQGRAGGGHQGLERDRHGGTGPAGVQEAGELHPLALILAARARGMPAPAGPDGGLGEVVEPRAPAASRGVQGFLLVARVAGREVGDRARRAVPEPHGGLQVTWFRAGDGVDLLGQAVRPPAERVDEVAALTGEPGSFQLLVAVPAVGLQGASVDKVAGHRAVGRLAEPRLHLHEQRRETPVETHYEPVVAGGRDCVDHLL